MVAVEERREEAAVLAVVEVGREEAVVSAEAVREEAVAEGGKSIFFYVRRSLRRN
jgi:hypothetical protein